MLGIPCAKLIATQHSPATTPAIWGDLLEEALDSCEKSGLTYLVIRTSCSTLHTALEQSNFVMLEELLHLECHSPSTTPKYPIRNACPEDMAQLLKIARNNPVPGRFHSDPILRKERVDDVYPTWLQHAWQSPNKEVFVVLSEEQPIGFAVLKGSHLDLIAVSQMSQQRGFGTALVQAMLLKTPKATVCTQAHNKAALRMYQKVGFQITHTERTYRLSLAEE